MPEDSTSTAPDDFLALTADIVAAHVSNNRVTAGDLPALITSVHAALAGLDTAAGGEPPAKLSPAVSIRASVKPDYIVCLEDGKKLKMLKRYLRTNFDLSPDEYRRKWSLPSDYPMVAPSYAEKRRGLAHAIGLGRKKTPEGDAKPAVEAGAVAEPRAKRGRPRKVVDESGVVDASARKPREKRLNGAEALSKARRESTDA